MDIRIKTNDYQMTPEISDYVDERVAHIEKFLKGDAEQARMEVELSRVAGHHKHTDHMYFAEFQLIRPGVPVIVARNNEPTVNAAIDNAKAELLRQLRQGKQAHIRVWRKGGALAKRLLRLE